MSGQKKIVIKHLILYEKCNTGVGSKSPQNSVLMYLNSPLVKSVHFSIAAYDICHRHSADLVTAYGIFCVTGLSAA